MTNPSHAALIAPAQSGNDELRTQTKQALIEAYAAGELSDAELEAALSSLGLEDA